MMTANPTPSSEPTTAPPKLRHEWFQTDFFVTISLFMKNVLPENCSVDISEREVFVSVKHPTGSTVTWHCELSHGIVPGESGFSVLKTKIEIKLKKAVIGAKWGVLEGEDNTINGVVVAAADQDAKPVYPSSSKKRIDFDNIAPEEDKPEGEAALNALFQQIYRDGSEETRRAMMKSFIESNGTCLSTNWDEVGKGKVETKPPEGMEVRKF